MTCCLELDPVKRRSLTHVSGMDGVRNLVGNEQMQNDSNSAKNARLSLEQTPSSCDLGHERFRLAANSAFARIAQRQSQVGLMPELEHICLHTRAVLMDADSSLDHVYFPDSGVVSVLAVYGDGSMSEMATIGREGCTGVQAALGAKTSSAQFLVQIPGSARKDVAQGIYAGDGFNAVLPKSHVCLQPRLSRTGHGVGSGQRRAQPEGAAGALAPHECVIAVMMTLLPITQNLARRNAGRSEAAYHELCRGGWSELD